MDRGDASAKIKPVRYLGNPMKQITDVAMTKTYTHSPIIPLNSLCFVKSVVTLKVRGTK